jgi:hypothetical protein
MKRVLVGYKMVSGRDDRELTNAVNGAIADDFVPYEAPIVNKDGVIYQAMVCYEYQKEEGE